MKKIILVTGASSGLGLATASLLCAQGHIVYGTSRSNNGIKNIAFHSLQMDVTEDASVQAAVEKIIVKEGRIDVLVNNAGNSIVGPLYSMKVNDMEKQFAVNFFGVVRVSTAVLPGMIEKRKGLVINISSLAGLFGLPYQGLYCASKFALEGYSQSLRMELQKTGIYVTVINPGDFKTPITSNREKLPFTLSNDQLKKDYEAVIDYIEKDENKGEDAKRLASLVCSIVNNPKPAQRYLTGAVGQTIVPLLKSVLPGSLFVKLMNRHYGIK